MAVVKSPMWDGMSSAPHGLCGKELNSFASWVYVFPEDAIAIEDVFYDVHVEGDMQVIMLPFQSYRAHEHPGCRGTFSDKALAAQYASGAPLRCGDEIREATLMTVRVDDIVALISTNGLVSDFLFEGDDIEEVDGFLFYTEKHVEPVTTAATRDAKRQCDRHPGDAMLFTKRIRIEPSVCTTRYGRVVTPPNVYIKSC